MSRLLSAIEPHSLIDYLYHARTPFCLIQGTSAPGDNPHTSAAHRVGAATVAGALDRPRSIGDRHAYARAYREIGVSEVVGELQCPFPLRDGVGAVREIGRWR